MRVSKTYKQSEWLVEGPEEMASLKADQAREVEDLKRRHEDEVENLKLKHERESERQSKKDEAEAEREAQQEDTLPDIEDSKYLSELGESLVETTDREIKAIQKLSKDMQSVLKGYQNATKLGDKELKDVKHNDTYKAILDARDKLITLIGTLQTDKLLKGEELEEGKLVADDLAIIDSAVKSIKTEMVKSLKKSREAGVNFINSMFKSAGLKSKVSAKMQAKGRLFLLKQELVKENEVANKKFKAMFKDK